MYIKNKYIDPFTDFGFKRIFGTEKNKHFLISFLNDLLDIEDKIIDLQYRNLAAFHAAELSALSNDEQRSYQQALKRNV